MGFFYNTAENKYLISSNKEVGGCYAITPQSYFKAIHPNLYPYDIECYPNVFTVTFYRPSDKGVWRFEISDRVNNGVELFEFLTSIREGRMAGFNNEGYDYPVIHELVLRGGHVTAAELYAKSKAIIEGDSFEHMVWESDRYVQQIDLFKIHHFNNKARSTSLKMLEFNMRSQNIQDIPFPPGMYLNNQQIDVLIKYNDHDTFETSKFLEHSLPAIEFRDELSAKYDRDFTNYNDTKIGKEYFIMELEKNNIPCFTRGGEDGKQPIQTKRDYIDLDSIILPWVKFSTPEFQMILDWLKQTTIEKTKGCFEFIEVSPQMAMRMNPTRIKVHGLTHDDVKATDNQLAKGIVLSKFETFPSNGRFVSGWKDVSGLNCIVNGFLYDFGTGGIHGSVDPQIVSSDEDDLIVDLDAASYYPNLGISNGFYPEHLSKVFCDIYQDVYNQRKTFAKGTPENAMLKLALNGVYGDSNSQYSPFYDPAYTMSITINGQLLLCLLAEYLGSIDGLTMVQINTDGLTVKCPRNQISSLDFIASAWEHQTGLELERNDYNRMMIRDVNNYIAESLNGKLKRKGAYAYGKDLDWSQNHSAQVVAIAAEAALVRGEPIEQTIRQHPDIMDFMLRTKVPRTSRLMWGYDQLQNTTRYYISNGGLPLIKVMPPTPAQLVKDAQAPERKIGIDVGWNVTPCNNLKGASLSDINYDYYIEETKKLVNPLMEGTE